VGLHCLVPRKALGDDANPSQATANPPHPCKHPSQAWNYVLGHGRGRGLGPGHGMEIFRPRKKRLSRNSRSGTVHRHVFIPCLHTVPLYLVKASLPLSHLKFPSTHGQTDAARHICFAFRILRVKPHDKLPRPTTPLRDRVDGAVTEVISTTSHRNPLSSARRFERQHPSHQSAHLTCLCRQILAEQTNDLHRHTYIRIPCL
jgi:hypothetical protein